MPHRAARPQLTISAPDARHRLRSDFSAGLKGLFEFHANRSTALSEQSDINAQAAADRASELARVFAHSVRAAAES
jgi:hypothetical protein